MNSQNEPKHFITCAFPIRAGQQGGRKESVWECICEAAIVYDHLPINVITNHNPGEGPAPLTLGCQVAPVQWRARPSSLLQLPLNAGELCDPHPCPAPSPTPPRLPLSAQQVLLCFGDLFAVAADGRIVASCCFCCCLSDYPPWREGGAWGLVRKGLAASGRSAGMSPKLCVVRDEPNQAPRQETCIMFRLSTSAGVTRRCTCVGTELKRQWVKKQQQCEQR
ncbi:hypothetical protein E2C01_014345 [Portunus trituberculatus]|uniref:Uncharacterized protein n=1 Tax=Portunus trituberculatus TaxID=210409 RepID=A0A5B7DIJ7_PORTR|nr:hypothetical protein [Portunus trituberculatus]